MQDKETKNLKKEYWLKAERFTRIIRHVPFVRFVGVNGSMLGNRFHQGSDIDLLIITQENRLWTCRFFVTSLALLLGVKRTSRKIAGQICLNRFITTSSLTIYPRDRYHGEVYSQTRPLFDQNIYERFKRQNEWMKNYSSFPSYSTSLVSQSAHQKSLERVLNSSFGLALENWLKDIQITKIKLHPLTKKDEGLIIASKHMICFHPTSATNLTIID